MTLIDIEALSTPELYNDLCNIVERNYHDLPRPGSDDDDGIRYSSDEARAAANDILDAVYRVFGAERPKVDPIEWVKGTFPGHTDAWYAAHLSQMLAYIRGEELPDLPDE